MGKKSVTLNLKTTTGVSLLKELVKEADILVENFSPRVMPSLGLSYEVLREINPRLVMTSISNFGQTGPYRDYQAQDIVITAMGGLSYATGDAGREPLKPGGSQAQYAGGTAAFTATMLAVFGAQTNGEGQHVDISLLETIAGNLESIDLHYAFTGEVIARGRYRYTMGYPIDVYGAKDGLFLLSARGTGGSGMDMLALLVEKPELVAHPLFDRLNPMARMNASNEEFDELIVDYFATHDRLEIIQRAQELHMPFAPVQNSAELLNDPQMAARGFFVELDHPAAGKWRYPGVPWLMSESTNSLRRAPLLGEHNQEILGGRLGLSQTDLVSLRAVGCI
jgi:crotonobetainyl-CoA:carnitine CoA-transferase CaiB-like acyl-CoA transferase